MSTNDDGTYQGNAAHVPTASGPNRFDRAIGILHGLPDVIHTNVSNIRVVQPLGVGGVETYTVQTYRHKEQGDTIFLEYVSSTGVVRLALPAAVANAIARQRDQLNGKSRSKAAKAVAQDRKARGIKPAFLNKKKEKAK